ncbi:MAG TPA: hypothetical protein VFS59_04120 [Gemmatimonadaceae bacterium]|nr:hypothetical protein [Gemmatimonadaceae bacterium]
MRVQDMLELVIWIGVVTTRAVARAAEAVLEGLFLALTWIALLLVGAVMACQRGGLPWTDPSDSRATSRSPDSTARRGPRR